MAFEILHTLVSRRFTPEKITAGGEAFFKVDLSGELPVVYPGRVNRGARATFIHRVRDEPLVPVDGGRGSKPLHGGFTAIDKIIPLTLRIFTPDGREFTNAEISLADLLKHRDPRGLPSGLWSFSLTGESEHIIVDDGSTIVNARGTLNLSITEKFPSESAPPLIDNSAITPARQSFQFDLFRVGEFVAQVSQLQIGEKWQGVMRLLDPDGVVVAQTTRPKLSFKVDLRTLGKSRDAKGKVRKWTLELSPQGGVIAGNPRISATVIGSIRINTVVLNDRIETLLGSRGSFIKIFGENIGGEALGRIMITDVVTAETIEMHDLLEDLLEGVTQDDGVDPNDIKANVVYTLARKSEKLIPGIKLEVKTLKVKSIDITIGRGVELGPTVPAVRVSVAVSGAIKVKFGSATLATAKVRGGKFEMEVGIKLDSNGTPLIVTALPVSPFDIDISTAVELAFAATLGIGGLIGGLTVTEFLEHVINELIVDGAQRIFANPTIAPRILMTISGAHYSYLPIRIDGDEIILDFIAPLEPEPKPTPGYQGAIGRSFTRDKPNAVSFIPRTLGNTWRADNLTQKIDHIVVVMMENRSYDHVLGYRAQPPFSDGADGLTGEMIEAIEAAPDGPFDVRGLREAGFPKNAVQKMTRLPKGVGHDVSDVEQQLSLRTDGPDNRIINSPKGFVENFKRRLKTDPQGVVPDDVLGFYDNEDLPFFSYLADNYTYCDRYFCSHPGPTIPNRMFSLTGDVMYDRYGIPILENNDSDNFLLSRAQTIYDLLTRKGFTFRVYESFPSVSMLRMFARYATDNTNIVPIDRLAADVAKGDLPAMTAIEPAMHHFPQNDDHPDADMYRGQIFLMNVYNTLRSNAALWERTLLIVTYDEHGGLYDHVVPPVADVYNILGRGGGANVRGGVVGPVGGGVVLGGNQPATPNLPNATPAPASLTVPYGLRVPTFVVSPWTVRGKGPSLTLDHCSILKTVLARFLGTEQPFFSNRVNQSHSFEAFLTEATPRMDVPPFDSNLLPPLPLEDRQTLSKTSQIITPPLSRKEMREGPVDFHVLTGRWARQLGR